MKYVEAFNKLGYEVSAPRTDWTSEKDDGVCLTLWTREVEWTPQPPSLNLFEMSTPGSNAWEKLPGHAKRTMHLSRAMNEFGGRVDVVLVKGIPGEGIDSADPWLTDQRNGFGWRLTKFDSETGFFSVVAEKLN